MFATLCLASPDTSKIDLSYIDAMPSPDAPTLHCTGASSCQYTSARVMIGQVFEQQGRHSDAITWAQAELQVAYVMFYTTAFSILFMSTVCLTCRAAPI
jgi:hypothetical protein